MYSVYLIDYDPNPGARPPEPPKREKLYIYDQLTHDEGMMLTEPELSIAASSADSFSFNLPKTNYGYGKILRTITRVVVEKDDKVIFMGRINSDDEDIWQNQRIEAEGALTYLNDSLSEKRVFLNKDRTQENRLTVYKLAEEILNYHNNKFRDEPWKQFHVVTDIPVQNRAKFVGRDSENVNSDAISYYSINYDNPLELLQEIVELADGAFRIKYNEDEGYWDVYIYGKYNFPVNNSQPIEFGLNLLDLTKTNDNSSVATVVAPFGGDAIQEPKEIGEVIAGKDVTDSWNTWWGRHWYLRATDDVGGAYGVYPAESDGYWVFKLDIANYNTNHPNNLLKKLYISYRGFKGVYGDYIEDCAWRIYDSVGNTLGYKKYETDISQYGFDSEINEMIDLSTPEYVGAAWIFVCGWGGLVPSVIRRDATVVEENDKLTIEKCDEFIDVDGFTHYAGSPYLISNDLVDKYGVIEKKLEYNIEDSLVKVSNFPYPTSGPYNDPYVYYDGVLGKLTYYDGYMLGYNAGQDGTDLKSNLGNYEIKPLSTAGGGYACVEYQLPALDSPNRPRGVFISCRMNDYGVERYVAPDSSVWYYKANGMYAIFDTVGQVLAYKSAGEDGFTSIKDEYIDLSDAKYYGAMTIRVGAWGGNLPPKAIPTDDKIAQDRLLAQAKLYLSNYQWEKTVIEATAVDLNMTDDSWEALDICTNVGVYSVNYYLPITSLTIRLDDFSQNKIILGYDNEEYITTQLSQEQRLLSVTQSLDERRTKQ